MLLLPQIRFACGISHWLLVAALSVLGYPFSQAWIFQCQLWFGKGWCFWMGIKIGGPKFAPPQEGILIANHASMFDIFILSTFPMPIRWISKDLLGKIPFIGYAMRALGCYFVKRNQTGKDLATLKVVEEDLYRGALVAIFPEGTRTRDGNLQGFKKGAFHLARNTGCPIYPVALKGTFSIAPKGAIPEKAHHEVQVLMGSPFTVGKDAPLESAVQQARNAIESLLN